MKDLAASCLSDLDEVSPRTSLDAGSAGNAENDELPLQLVDSGFQSPPEPPVQLRAGVSSSETRYPPEILPYDFSQLDYEIQRSRVAGEGLWSIVLLADAKNTCNINDPVSPLTSPPPPSKRFQASSIYAIKTPARSEAMDVFAQEAKILTHLMRQRSSRQYIVPFLGLDMRNGSLVFEAVLGGSLESLNSRLKQMTEVARHLELVHLFPGIAHDLISGLGFIHGAGVTHADIKPANVLLDISEHYSLPRPVIRARYIDFSAAFRMGSDDTSANAGGTWEYMAPEQMRVQKDFNKPTYSSDVWSLGITLLTLIVGGSPYAAACGNNMFMLREAIKRGDPLGFARMDPRAQKRIAAAQDFVDCCRVALKRDREKRVTAGGWKQWLERSEIAG